ncbi:MAG TPA: hypothetical protein VFO48_04275 [Vicinamibacterales bacterium]|nr:hypothetical protein [Vicinamibacterales bacterium]
MPNQFDRYVEDPRDTRVLALAAIGITAVGLAVVFAARRRRRRTEDLLFGFDFSDEQAVTVKASLEIVEAAWVEWCASGLTRLKNNYAVRFEPAPGARGTEVHLSGGGSTGTIREELRHFKQRLETGEIPLSDGPGLSRPAQPRESDDRDWLAEVR